MIVKKKKKFTEVKKTHRFCLSLWKLPRRIGILTIICDNDEFISINFGSNIQLLNEFCYIRCTLKINTHNRGDERKSFIKKKMVYLD